jgi:hypothetical protein
LGSNPIDFGHLAEETTIITACAPFGVCGFFDKRRKWLEAWLKRRRKGARWYSAKMRPLTSPFLDRT